MDEVFTLRDRFAVAAMKTMVVRDVAIRQFCESVVLRDIAVRSCILADEMMKAREQQEDEDEDDG